MTLKKKKFKEGCSECGMIGRHPFCPLCSSKCHWFGGVVNAGEKDEDIERYAPSRTLSFPKDAVTMAFMIPLLVREGKIPEDQQTGIIERLLRHTHPQISVEGIRSFEYGKVHFRWKLDSGDFSGQTEPYLKLRHAGWECRNHRGALPADIPAMALERDVYTCVICGCVDRIVPVYMTPIKKEGRTTLANVVAFCESCAKDRGDQAYWQYLADRGIPINDILIDFSCNLVRSFVVGGRVRF